MRKVRIILALLLVFVLLGGTAALAAEAGEYTLFALQNDGFTADSNEMDMYSTLTLNEEGTGSLVLDAPYEITSWSAEEGTLTIVMDDGSSTLGTIHDGIIELDVWGTGEMILYYAQEGADTSGIEIMTVDEILAAYAAAAPDSRLYALWSSLDITAGVHLVYDLHVDFLDADQRYDVQGRDGLYYSQRTTQVSGLENTSVTYCQDGKAYNLDPSDGTGLFVTESGLIADNAMPMDSLYSAIRSHAEESDYIEETREMDGVTYTAEIFPATEYTPEAAFYFDDDGQLAYYIEGAPVIETAVDIGESVYTIRAIDDAVDDTLFDLSGYDISE